MRTGVLRRYLVQFAPLTTIYQALVLVALHVDHKHRATSLVIYITYDAQRANGERETQIVQHAILLVSKCILFWYFDMCFILYISKTISCFQINMFSIFCVSIIQGKLT